MEWLYDVVSEPYYVFHIVAFFSYIPIRISASHILSPSSSYLLLRREIQATLVFFVLNAIKIVREETWQAVIADALFFAKLIVVAITSIIDYHLALWYSLIFLVIYMLSQQPASKCFGTSIKLTPLQLESVLTEGNSSKNWLVGSLDFSLSCSGRKEVEFRASCSSNCIRLSQCFPELSITYSNKNLSFGLVDLGLFPNAAEKYGILLKGMGQLPTYILFENGAEVNRFPEVGFEAKPFSQPVTKALLCHHFELDRLLLEYVNGK